MGFYEDVLAIEMRPPGPNCAIGKLLNGDDTEFVVGLRKVLADPEVARIQLSQGLKDIGHNISANTVTRHQLERCSCPTTS